MCPADVSGWAEDSQMKICNHSTLFQEVSDCFGSIPCQSHIVIENKSIPE